jgi:pimeloyl-ACP methyl ester carboxylesterase
MTRFVVVLVHGTFAAKAPWTRPGSKFREVLEHRLRDIHIESFDWTGANSENARRLAGQELRQKLVELHRAYPQALVYVVGHSHGGNVALYATNENPSETGVAGVVAIATPFLRARIRRVPKSAATLFNLVLNALFWALVSWLLPQTVLRAAQELLGMVVWVVIGTARIPGAMYRSFRLWVARRQNAVIQRLPWSLPACRILNLQTSLDEARLHLNVLGLCANVLVVSLTSLVWLALISSYLGAVTQTAASATPPSPNGLAMVGGLACSGHNKSHAHRLGDSRLAVFFPPLQAQ